MSDQDPRVSDPSPRVPPEIDPSSPVKRRGSGHDIDNAQSESTHARYGTQWDEYMGHTSKPVNHKSAAVLLLSWDPAIDDLDVEDEVNRLEAVFRDLYKFKVRNEKLGKDKARVKKQALAHLSRFAADEDDKDALLIVYYAGHGSQPETGLNAADIVLGGRRPPPSAERLQENAQSEQFLWSSVESAIHDLEGDLLLIFDCCEAGRLCRAHPEVRGLEPEPGPFEFLGSCVENHTTRSAGPHSFTSALIAALSSLAKKDTAFDTSELRQTIKKHPDFPTDQEITLSGRFRPGEGISIDRRGLPAQVTDKALSKSADDIASRNKGHIDVRIRFESAVDERIIKQTALRLKEGLRDVRDRSKQQISRIDFLGASSRAEELARMFLAQAQRKRKIVIENADEVVIARVSREHTLRHHVAGIGGILCDRVAALQQWVKIMV